MNCIKTFRFAYSASIICLFLTIVFCVYTQERIQEEKQVLAVIQADERVIDIQADFPEIRLSSSYHDEFCVWIIELIHEDAGKVGLITVNPESGNIEEFGFDFEKIVGKKAEENMERENDDDASCISLLTIILPRFHGASSAWLSLLFTIVLFGNWKRITSLVHLDIILLHALAPFLLLTWSHTQIAYTGIFLITVLLFIRCLSISIFQRNAMEAPALSEPRVLMFLLLFAILLHVVTVYSRGIGDAGIWSAIGADYLWQTGRLPYGTDFGPNCIYGPLMYVLFLPANLFAPAGVTVMEPGTIVTPHYETFVMYGVQTTVLLLDLITLWALYLLARRSSDQARSMAIVFIYAVSPYLLGIRSEIGLERVSHVAGIPFLLVALLCTKRPGATGVLLGIATGMLYYPVFLTPLWFGYHRRHSGFKHALLFIGGYAAVGIVCLIMILGMVHPIDDVDSPLHAFLDDSILQQQFKEGYGNSPLSFWGQYPILASWGKPMAGFAYCLFCLSLFFIPRRIGFPQLLALSTAILVASQLALSFAGGTYIGFYYALLVLILFQNSMETTV